MFCPIWRINSAVPNRLDVYKRQDLCVTPEQRAYMYQRVREMREYKPIFILDFWNDGEYVGGCIAGGRRYFHINSNGDCEPCAFIHYATHNINECTLEEALGSPLFRKYQEGQPFSCLLYTSQSRSLPRRF